MQTGIRKWNSGDIAEIAAMESLIFPEPWNERMLVEEFSNPFYECYVAECGKAIAGYAGFHNIADEIHISNIAVREEYRRNNIASDLLQFIVNKALHRRLRGITLEVRSNNIAAIALYKKFGFSTEGIRKKYYSGKDDALIMWRYFTY